MGTDPSTNSNKFSPAQVEDPTPEVSSTTRFVSEANAVFVESDNVSRISKLFLSSSSSDENQSIKDFLAKPILIGNGSLASTDTVSTFPQIHFPYAPLSNALVADKLRGFLGFRATVVIKLQINANRFQQGRYMFCFVQSGGASTQNTRGALRYLSHTNTKQARSQLPKIELDLACDSEGTMKIPFTSVMNYYPMRNNTVNTGFGSWGTAQLFPYVALTAPTGSSTCSYFLWAHFEDVELISAACPQSGRMMTGKKSRSEKEAQSQSVGPITSSLIKIRDASSLLKPVPFISDYAGGLSWLADIGANAASVFGWSKPRNQSAVNRNAREALPNFCNVDTVDQGQSLSLSNRNAVGVAPGFSSTNIDEMDFSFIATIPGYLSATNWTTSNTIGDVLLSIDVKPTYGLSSRSGLGGIGITDYIPIQFVADYFNLWRGSMVYTFKIVKTEFHSGRLAFAFYPIETDLSVPTINFAASPYVHREIIDVRDNNEITIRIPFVSSAPFRPTYGNDSPCGRLEVYVLNPLVAPSSVSSTITIITEMAGGPDIEFAIPIPNANAIVLNATPQSGPMMTGVKKAVNSCGIEDITIGSSSTKNDNSINAEYCIGEKVSSFRTLMKSTYLLNYMFTPESPKKYIHIMPFAASVYYNGISNPYPFTVGDLYSTLCGIFAMSRGGVRLKFMVSAGDHADYPAVTSLYQFQTGPAFSKTGIFECTNTDPNGGTGYFQYLTSGLQSYHHVKENFGAEVSVPQYHRYHSRANFDHTVNTNSPYEIDQANLSSRSMITYTVPGNADIASPYVARGGSDDLNFGVFISIPPTQRGLGFGGTL